MKNNEQFSNTRRRKILWFLPLLILPFATLFFWAMGGGSPTATSGKSGEGFNLKLPSAKVTDNKELDKLNYYEQAAIDSSKVDELRRKDPNYRFDSIAGNDSIDIKKRGLVMSSLRSPQEEQVYKRLEALQRAVNTPPSVNKTREESAATVEVHPSSVHAAELEQMIQSMSAGTGRDPEMEQIGGMLENILDIQYPERVAQKLREESQRNRGRVYTISNLPQKDVISSISQQDKHDEGTFAASERHTGFFSLENQEERQLQDNAVKASIAETQSVVNGATVKMILEQEIYINGKAIPKGTFLVGTASLKGERLAIEIQNIRDGNSIYPVELKVYDLDGLDGIYIPGAINREVAKASADRSMQTLGVTTLSDSWGAQAAGVGVEAAKGLFSRKVKLVKVTLKKGYQILLKDEKQEE